MLDKIDDMFLRYGFKSISMDDIARELGVSKKTLYQYVDSKNDLVKQVMHRHIDKDLACIEGFVKTSKDAIEELMLIAAYILETLKKLNPKTIYELKKYYREIYDDWESFHKSHVYREIKENLNRGVVEGVYRSDFDTDIVARLYMGRSMAIMDDQLFDPKKYKLYDVFIEHIRLHFYGLVTTKGLKLYKKYAKL